MKKILKLFTFLFVLFIFSGRVNANSIDSITMNIYIDSAGNAYVTEVWDAYLSQGTEGYHPYYNLENATISNFSVKDESNKYETISTWDVSQTLEQKAYKAGINEINNGVELCWGISSYGQHTYTLTYTINDFVAETSDSQIVYWTLIPYELSSKPDNVYIKIYADQEFSDNLPVWGYGNYGGTAYVYDGYIELSKDYLDSDEYMTVLVKFDKGTFNTSNIVDHDFKYYEDMANEGATAYNDEPSTISTIVSGFLIFVFNIISYCIPILIFMAIFNSAKKSSLKCGTYVLDYGSAGKNLPKEVNMFRDIPCNKDIYRAYWVASNYGLMKRKTDFMGVILLKWLKDGIIKIEKISDGKIIKREESVIVFKSRYANLENLLENSLYTYMYEASKDGILESKEFEKWCKNHYSSILNWFDSILDDENRKLLSEGKLTKVEKKSFGIFNNTVYTVDPSMKEEAIQMKGLKEFFNEFETIQDKEAIEVMFWQDYLMYAQLFGVADKVAKQFKKLYPDVITDYSYDSIVFVNHISYTGISSASSARARAQSYNSGGGGFSSGGGGGGSFGGGGGGGGFR